MSDPWDDPDTRKWMEHVRTELIPKLNKSRMTLSLFPSEPSKVDIKFAVELGLSICFDKPLIVVISPGQQLPGQLVRVANEIVEWDGDGDPMANQRLIEAIDRVGHE